MEWIGCTVCEIFAFKLYRDLETGVQGHSRSSKVTLFDRAHTTLYSSSIVTMPLSSINPFRDIAAKLIVFATPLVFGAPVGGEAVRFTQRPLVMKNYSVSGKKRTNSILGLTSSNIGRFSKFLQCHNLLKICNKTVIKFPTTPQTRCYTTL